MLIALALVLSGFRGRGPTTLLISLPLSSPEIVLGASLLTLFLNLKVVFGFWTILIAHVMFCISFAVVTIKARLIGFDRHLEEAAMDLGANEWATFTKVTLPLIAPAILASMLLCFAVSVDDFVVTYFNAGPRVTFPIFVWNSARVGAPPQGWWDEAGADEPAPALEGDSVADVCIVGGGYTGLWTALALRGREPSAQVVLVEAEHCGSGPSGRNGGFIHGYWANLAETRITLGAEGALELARAGARIIPAVRALPDDVWLREGGMIK